MQIHSVTVEGSLMPAAGVLERGERATWAYTDQVAQLIQFGYLKVIEYHTDEVDADSEEEALEPGQPGGELVDPPEQVEVPKGNASEEEWKAFYDSQEIQYPEDVTRDQLREGWKAIEQQRTGGS